MNGRQERERHKAQLLRQIQQQRLELSACRRHWHEATAPLDRGWHTLLSLRSWLMVGSGLMAVWSVRHPHFLMRWTKRGLGLWSNMRLFRSAPFSTTPFTSRHTRTGGGPSRSVHFRLLVLIAQKL